MSVALLFFPQYHRSRVGAVLTRSAKAAEDTISRRTLDPRRALVGMNPHFRLLTYAPPVSEPDIEPIRLVALPRTTWWCDYWICETDFP